MNTPDRDVESIWFEDDTSASLKDGERFVLRNFFHGTYDEDWICVLKDNKELRRLNPRFIASIIFT